MSGAVKIKTHSKEAGLCDKGGLIFSFVVAFSGTLLCGRQKSTKAVRKIKIIAE